MAIDYSKYPKNWLTEIRPAVLARANNCCEECGIENYAEGWRFPSGNFYTVDDLASQYMPAEDEAVMDAVLSKKPNPYKIVLTIAHLDRTGPEGENDGPLDCPIDRLKAMCQRCHLTLDKERHRAKRMKKAAEPIGLFKTN